MTTSAISSTDVVIASDKITIDEDNRYIMSDKSIYLKKGMIPRKLRFF